jgi:hypothetical protein
MNKKLLVSIGIIGVLVVILLIVNRAKSPDVPSLGAWEGNADEILIVKGGNRVRVYRDRDAWRVGDEAYPADPEAVREMENRLKNLTVTDLISDRPHYERYELSADKAIEVSARKGSGLVRHLFIGKKSSTYRHTYIRLADRPEVYLASGSLGDDFGKSLDDLRSKEIFKIGRGDITSLEITFRGRRLSFSKIQEEKKPDTAEKEKKDSAPAEKTEKWVCNEFRTIALDDSMMDQIFSSLDPLKAASFPALERKDLQAPVCSVRIKSAGKTIELTIHQKHGENRYLCSSGESPYVFALEGWMAERFMKSMEDLRKK